MFLRLFLKRRKLFLIQSCCLQVNRKMDKNLISKIVLFMGNKGGNPLGVVKYDDETFKDIFSSREVEPDAEFWGKDHSGIKMNSPDHYWQDMKIKTNTNYTDFKRKLMFPLRGYWDISKIFSKNLSAILKFLRMLIPRRPDTPDCEGRLRRLLQYF